MHCCACYKATVGDDLTVVKQDQLIRSDPVAYKRRRTIAIERALGGSCGFTLQVSYLFACLPVCVLSMCAVCNIVHVVVIRVNMPLCALGDFIKKVILLHETEL